MVAKYPKKCLVIHLTAASDMSAEKCESLNFMLKHATAATLW